MWPGLLADDDPSDVEQLHDGRPDRGYERSEVRVACFSSRLASCTNWIAAARTRSWPPPPMIPNVVGDPVENGRRQAGRRGVRHEIVAEADELALEGIELVRHRPSPPSTRSVRDAAGT